MRRDWDAVRMAYVTGSETLRQLAERMAIPVSSVFRRASAEAWVEQKEQERARVASAVQERTRQKRIKREAAALARVETQIERLLAEIERALKDEKQLYRYIIRGTGTAEECTFGKMDTKAARDLMAILAEMKASLEGMGGVLDKRTAEEIRLKKARLKLDQRKAGLEGKTDDETTGVVLMPAVDESEIETVEVE